MAGVGKNITEGTKETLTRRHEQVRDASASMLSPTSEKWKVRPLVWPLLQRLKNEFYV
jgi:hypothetical protein